MDDLGTHSNWAHFQERWLDYAQRAKEQWPEIPFSDLLATRGSRDLLLMRVSQTYGLQEGEADRAIAIWQESQMGRLNRRPSTTDSPAA